jgi:hypothetical protein
MRHGHGRDLVEQVLAGCERLLDGVVALEVSNDGHLTHPFEASGGAVSPPPATILVAA